MQVVFWLTRIVTEPFLCTSGVLMTIKIMGSLSPLPCYRMTIYQYALKAATFLDVTESYPS